VGSATKIFVVVDSWFASFLHKVTVKSLAILYDASILAWNEFFLQMFIVVVIDVS
jgi:hypothetical protein